MAKAPDAMRLVTAGEQPGRRAGTAWGPPGRAMLSGWAELSVLQVLRQLESSPRGLAEDDAQERLTAAGQNMPANARPPGWPTQLAHAARDPFVMVLLGLDALSLAIGSGYSAAVISVLIALSCLLRFRQERRGSRAAAALRDVVAATATVVRRASPAAGPAEREVPFGDIVPGDIVRLGPGDMVPADLRLLRSDGLAVSQALLSGESLPVPKEAGGCWPDGQAPLDCPWLCLTGSSVTGGCGTGVVVATGPGTYLAAAQPGIRPRPPETSFESGMKRVSWTLIWFMAVSLGSCSRSPGWQAARGRELYSSWSRSPSA